MEQSLQDQYYPNGTCFGCGPCNDDGLQIKSYSTNQGVMATWTASEKYDNGFGFVNGGIISTLLDCHSAASVMKETVKRYGDFCIDNFEHFDDKHPVYLTNQINVTFRRPILLHSEITLFSECISWDDNACNFRSEIRFNGKIAANADVHWKRFRSRRQT